MEITKILFLFVILVFELVFLLFAIFILVSSLISQAKGAPYVPLPRKSIRGILNFAELNPPTGGGSYFYDLGSGDGRVLIEAVKNFGIKKAVGYEISPWPYLKSKILISMAGLKEKIDIFRSDFVKADLRNTDFVFLYLFPKLVQKLASKFKEELALGSKVISVSFPIENPEKFNLRLKKEGEIDRFKVFIYEKM